MHLGFSPPRLPFLLLLLILYPLSAAATPPSFICLTAKCHPSIAEDEFVHGPIGSGMCPLCHDDGRPAENPPKGHPEVRVGTATEQCLLCHEAIGAMMERGSVHTPVADGECIDCHMPHGGDNSFFLKYPPTIIDGTRIVSATCKACHGEGESGWFDDFHAGEVVLDCVVCHNAHASSETYQLTRYVRSVYLKSALMEAADLKKAGQLDASAEAYTKALAIFPKDVKTILLLAGVHESRGAWGKALEEYEKVLALEPANVEALVRAAGAAGKLDDPGAEMAYLKKALDVEPRPDVHYHLGKIYRSRGQLQEAISEFSKAARIDPKYAPARSELAEVYEEMGMTRDAEEERRLLRELQ